MPTTERVITLEQGLTMIVTDLHGDGELYERYRDRFLALRAQGKADTLIITGDYIHREGAEECDASLDIALDLIALKRELGDDLIVLLGNHELPHLYHFSLAKGNTLYTPRFERALGEHRNQVLGFFAHSPFYVRTAAGVAICHAGSFPEAHNPAALKKLFTFSHQALMLETLGQIPAERRPALRDEIARQSGLRYPLLAKHYLAVSGPDDPRYDDYLIGVFAGQQPDFQLLWSAFFNANELDYGEEAYATHVAALLAGLSAGYVEQQILVTGHKKSHRGCELVAGGQQVRLASGSHARPYESAKYVLFDAGAPIKDARTLTIGLGSVF